MDNTLTILKVIDALETRVIADNHDDFYPFLHGGQQLSVEHCIGAIAHNGNTFSLGFCKFAA